MSYEQLYVFSLTEQLILNFPPPESNYQMYYFKMLITSYKNNVVITSFIECLAGVKGRPCAIIIITTIQQMK